MNQTGVKFLTFHLNWRMGKLSPKIRLKLCYEKLLTHIFLHNSIYAITLEIPR